MECAPKLYRYRQRDPTASPLYRLFDEHYEALKRVYPDRFEPVFGPWQRHWDAAVAAFLSCGDLHCGFARVYCDTCRKEFLLPHSCKQRSLCPSCDARRRAEWADHVVENVLPDLPYRMNVYAIPKHLRGAFLREHALLGNLSGEAYRVTARFLAAHFPGVDGVPYFVSAVHTFGSSGANPHPICGAPHIGWYVKLENMWSWMRAPPVRSKRCEGCKPRRPDITSHILGPFG